MRWSIMAPSGYEMAQAHAVVCPDGWANRNRRTLCGFDATRWPPNKDKRHPLIEVTCERCLKRIDSIQFGRDRAKRR
jgi:hypothetical protein